MDSVYVFKNNKLQLFVRKGSCVKCGNCCASLTNRSYQLIGHWENQLPMAEITEKANENDAVIFVKKSDVRNFIVLGVPQTWDYDEFIEFKKNVVTKTAKELVEKLNEKFPAIFQYDNNLTEEEAKAMLGVLPELMRVLYVGKRYELITIEQTKELLDAGLDGCSIEIYIYTMMWDTEWIGCGILGKEENGQRLCLDYLQKCEYTDPTGLTKEIPTAGALGRPILCQVSPIHPDETAGYGCAGFTFEDFE